MTPTTAHRLDQFLALALDVQVRLLAHRRALVEAGWTEPEAWVWCQRVEERVLGSLVGSQDRE